MVIDGSATKSMILNLLEIRIDLSTNLISFLLSCWAPISPQIQ